MNDTWIGVCIVLAAVVVSAFSQLLLKYAAQKEWSNPLREYCNLPVISAYVLFVWITAANVIALRYIPLSLFAALEATGQIAIPLVGRLFLGEKISTRRQIAMVTIILGILIFSL